VDHHQEKEEETSNSRELEAEALFKDYIIKEEKQICAVCLERDASFENHCVDSKDRDIYLCNKCMED
jgi:hypothetical protein